MRRLLFVAIFFGVFIGVVAAVSGAFTFNAQADSTSIKGDYVEVRTASVFAGACHYNGELTTTGRDALMAWNVISGEWRGVDLAGVSVVAIVNSDANLSDSNAPRQSEIIIGQNANDSQSRAILDAIGTNYASSLGKIVSVRRGPLSFEHQDKTYSVSAKGIASIDIEALANDECCKMPHLVWYSPLVPLENRKVGYTTKALYSGDLLCDRWQRSNENSAFYGTFSF
jgi:hypothetical protein